MLRLIMVLGWLLISAWVVDTPAFAQMRKDVGAIKGLVARIDSARGQMTVTNYSTNKNEDFTLDQTLAQSVSKDDEIIVFYKKDTRAVKTLKVLRKVASANVTAASVNSSATVAVEGTGANKSATDKKKTWW